MEPEALATAAAKELVSTLCTDVSPRWVRRMGHLEMLSVRSKLKKVKHPAALPFSEVGMFFEVLRKQESIAARALEFTILTACRSGEVLGAQWSEIDLVSRVWTLPPERTKAGREHKVPLVDAAAKLLNAQVGLDNTHVFPGSKEGKPLSVMAMSMVLRQLQQEGLTVHGFRSTFLDWVVELTEYPCDLAAYALAHTEGSAVENTYSRTIYLNVAAI